MRDATALRYMLSLMLFRYMLDAMLCCAMLARACFAYAFARFADAIMLPC